MGWKQFQLTSIGLTNLRSIHEVLRNNVYEVSSRYDGFTTYESGFIDLLNVHSIYIHSPNIGHDISIVVKGETTIIKTVPVSSLFGYLDSVVAPHDRIDVSRQLFKTMEFSFRNVHGKVMDLHGANISFSLIFATMD